MPKIGKKGQPLKATDKYPYKIELPGKEYFFMAGIWQPWTDRETGEQADSFAIVTTAANKLMAQVHNSKKRMPCILSEEDARRWILPDLTQEEVLKIVNRHYTEKQMTAYPVSKDFRTAADPEQPEEYAELPALEK